MGAPLQCPERGGVDPWVGPSVSHIQPPAGSRPAGGFYMRLEALLPQCHIIRGVRETPVLLGTEG